MMTNGDLIYFHRTLTKLRLASSPLSLDSEWGGQTRSNIESGRVSV